MTNNFSLESAFRFCSLLHNETIKEEIDKVLNGYTLKDIKLQNRTFECEFSKGNNEMITLLLSLKYIHLYRQNDKVLSEIFINDNILNQIDVEKRPNGIIYKELQKHFEESANFNDKTVLTDLIEDTYVFSKDKIKKIINKEDFSNVRLTYILLSIKRIILRNEITYICDLHNRFSTHINYYKFKGVGKDNIYPTRTYLNGEEVSDVFNINDRSDKLYRVYDLYNGIINPRNENDINSIHLGLLSENAFGFKELKGITSQEEELVGRSNLEVSNDYTNYLSKFLYDEFGYKGEIKIDRDTLLKGITYKMSAVEIAKRDIEKILGIPYEEYDKLDIDEQRRLMEQKTGKEFKYDHRLYIDAIPIDEEHIITREQIDKKIDEIVEKVKKLLRNNKPSKR